MKSFRLGVLAKVLYILLSCMQPSEAQDVSNAVCKWNRSTSSCQQDQQGLIDLLTEAGEAHTFALFMTCQYLSYKSQCNNLSTCVWENGVCYISSKKLVAEINSCFYTSSYDYIIIPCKNELVSISNSTAWISKHSLNPASSCRQAVGYFSSTTNTCRLMEYALQCEGRYSSYCEQTTSINHQAYQFVSNLQYIMSVQQQKVSLTFSYLERELDIRRGNLEGYYRCSSQDQQECEELPPLYFSPPPRKQKNGLSGGVIAGIVFGVLPVLGLCCAFLIKRRINERRQAQNLELVQINGNSQNTAQNQVARIGTADIIGALPSLEFMGAAENRSEQVCVICLEGLKEGEVSTALPCAHWFHKKCIESWINNKGSNVTCPLCNHPVSQQNYN